MKVLLSWLREFAPIEAAPDAVADALSDLGLAVESMARVGEAITDIRVARVLATRGHPDADRIQLVDVDPGSGDPVQVCCGAFNFAPGDLVPLAPIGAVMPDGLRIERRKLRGEWSNGMLCSAAELGLGSDHGGILVLDPNLEPGAPLVDALGLDGDTLYDLEVNPNRPDAMGVAGVARDLAARLRIPFEIRPVEVVETGPPVDGLARVEVVDEQACGRFHARIVRNVVVAPSPATIATRLRLCGMRPINNVVDASNYVMLELGQPNHGYDLSTLGGGGIRVRRAVEGEQLTTLDDVARTLGPADLLICDALDQPIGIAGVMGGAATEIAPRTTEVLLELAWFDPMTIARTAKRLGLRSEASARFERGTDPAIIDHASDRFCDVLRQSVPDLEVATGAVEAAHAAPGPRPVRLRPARVNTVLGTDLTTEEMVGHLERLGFHIDGTAEADALDVLVPTFRPDSTAEIDLVEEIARLHGYQRIPRTVPGGSRTGGLTPHQRDRRLVRDVLVGLGADEAMPVPFVSPDDVARTGGADAVRLANPLVQEESVLRTSLMAGLLAAVRYNTSHRNPDVALFEIGRVFRQPPAGEPRADEREHVAVAASQRPAPVASEVLHVLVDALAVADVRLEPDAIPGLHPTRGARVVAAGVDLGVIGEIDPAVLDAYEIDGRVAWLELDLGRLLSAPRHDRVYRPVSRYPSSDIDLALEVADEVPAAAVAETLARAAGALLADIALFDVFRGPPVEPGRRSLAFRLRFQAADRTLTDDEVAAARRACITAAEEAHGASLRGAVA